MTFLTKLCTKIEFCICTSSLLFCLGIMIHNTFVVSVAYFLHLLGFTMMQNYYHTLFYCLIYTKIFIYKFLITLEGDDDAGPSVELTLDRGGLVACDDDILDEL